MIDFAAIADAFRPAFAVQTHGWPTLFDRMDKLLDDLGDRSRDAERATRAYPVLRYRDGAVGVRLAPGPAPLLGAVDGTGRGLGEGLVGGARDLVSGFALVGTMVEQELALPRELSVLAGLAGTVDASLARYDRADPSMFEASARRFSDVFGLAGLGWRALQGARNHTQIRGAAESFALLLQPGTDAAGASSTGAVGPSGGSGPTGLAGLADLLDEKARLSTDALLLLPVAGLALGVLLDAGVLAAEEAIVGGVAGVEREVLGLRSDLVDGWLAAFDLGSTMHHLTSAADLVLSADSILLTTAVPVWLDGLLAGVQHLLRALTDWVAWAGSMVAAFQGAATDLMAVDLMPWIVRNVLGDWVARHVPLPSLTLEAVVALAAGEGDPSIRDTLDSYLDDVDELLSYVDYVHDVSGLRAKVADLRLVLGLTLSPTPFTYPPDVLPTGPIAGFPDVYAAVFGGAARADLIGAVRLLGADLQRSVDEVGTAGADLAAGLASTAEDELRHQRATGAGLAIQRRSAGEGSIVSALVAPLRSDLTTRVAGEAADPLAAAFEAQFQGAAGVATMAAVAGAIPAYLGEARRFWDVRSVRLEHPTSAHVLARSGRLGLVRVPRLTLGAHGRQPDPVLAAQVADGFRDVVRESYREGRRRLVAAAAPAGGERHGR